MSYPTLGDQLSPAKIYDFSKYFGVVRLILPSVDYHSKFMQAWNIFGLVLRSGCRKHGKTEADLRGTSDSGRVDATVTWLSHEESTHPLLTNPDVSHPCNRRLAGVFRSFRRENLLEG